MEKIIGLIDAPFTPMKPNGDINLEPIPAYAAMLVKNGLKGVFINGSSGEGYMLTTDERKQLAEAWMAAVPAGFKVIVHVGSCCLRESVELAKHAAAIGAWGIGAMAPPFPKIGRVEELVKYCETIAAAAPELPFYFYHIPAFNGAFLPMLDFLKAVDGRIPNFPGRHLRHDQLQRPRAGRHRRSLGGRQPGARPRAAELLAGGHQRNLPLPRQHRGRQADHEAHRPGPGSEPDSLAEHDRRGGGRDEARAGGNPFLRTLQPFLGI